MLFKKIFFNQIWHLFYIILFISFILLATIFDSELLYGSLFNIQTNKWLIVAILTPIIHQIYVAFIWRFELYTSVFTKNLGVKKAFKLYAVGFSILFVFRLITIIFLAFSNKFTLDIDPIVTYIILGFIIPVVIYLFYSVKKYFTIQRAYGIDHFDKDYNVPFVKKGIFKYTDNGMYIYGLMILYIPGLLLLSKAAILVAFFNHIYIWVHYYTTEQPDMKQIYRNTP